MKNFLCIFVLLQLLFSTYPFCHQDVFYASFCDKADSFCYVVKNENDVLNDEQTRVKCGQYSFVYFQGQPDISLNALYLQARIRDVSLLSSIIAELNIQIVFEEHFPNLYNSEEEEANSGDIRQIIYGYANKFTKYVYLNGYKINIQIVVKNCLIIGYPMVYTGF